MTALRRRYDDFPCGFIVFTVLSGGRGCRPMIGTRLAKPVLQSVAVAV